MMSKNWKSFQDLSLLQIGSLLDLLDTGFGTLWWVREDLWRLSLPHYASQHRTGHPGISIRSSKAGIDLSYVPMLHGRSRRGPVKVVGMTRAEPMRATYFGHLVRPARIRASAFTAETVEPGKIDWGRVRVAKNADKPRADQGEEEQLRQWWTRLARRPADPAKPDDHV